MNTVARERLRRLIALTAALLATFGLMAAFELRIAQSSARAESMSSEIADAEEALRVPSRLGQLERTVDGRLSELRLTAGRSAQDLALLGELDRIAVRRGIRLMGLRESGASPPVRTGPEFVAQGYEVAFEGAYPSTLYALGDLSRARLVLRTVHLSFERLAGPRPGEVRTTIDLDILHLSNPRRAGDDRLVAP